MRIYLDNCCYNRPFDDQAQVKVLIETLAKLNIQQQMRDGVVDYVWSEVLDFEVRQSSFFDRKMRILPWAKGASVNIELDESIRARAREFEAIGIKPMDSLHLACAEAADCDWFFTTDNGIMKKAKAIAAVRVANPIEFVGGV